MRRNRDTSENKRKAISMTKTPEPMLPARKENQTMQKLQTSSTILKDPSSLLAIYSPKATEAVAFKKSLGCVSPTANEALSEGPMPSTRI
jgi:hypothetical protein